jgi:hypothetical protein
MVCPRSASSVRCDPTQSAAPAAADANFFRHGTRLCSHRTSDPDRAELEHAPVRVLADSLLTIGSKRRVSATPPSCRKSSNQDGHSARHPYRVRAVGPTDMPRHVERARGTSSWQATVPTHYQDSARVVRAPQSARRTPTRAIKMSPERWRDRTCSPGQSNRQAVRDVAGLVPVSIGIARIGP